MVNHCVACLAGDRRQEFKWKLIGEFHDHGSIQDDIIHRC